MHLQGGTHKETPRPAVLVVDGAAGFLAEASVGFGVVKVKVAEAEEPELIYGEAQFPRDITPPDVTIFLGRRQYTSLFP